MITIKRKITVDVERRKKKGVIINENAPIFIRLTFLSNRINLYSGFRTNIADWDPEKKEVIFGRINSNEQNAEVINLNIAKYKSAIQSFFYECSIKNEIPTIEQVKDAYEKIKNDGVEIKNAKKLEVEIEESYTKKEKSFYEVFDEFTSYNGKINNWTADTYAKLSTLKSHLQLFNPKIKFKDLTLEELSNILSFFSKNLKLRNTITKKYIENIKWFLRYAVKKGYTENKLFEDFHPKLKIAKKKLIFLTESEILQIKDCVIPESKLYLERVRDVLLFLCYSGLRHSDVFKLKKSDIKNGKFDVTTLKTNDSLVIELNKTSQEIIDKYKDIPFKNDKALPVISNQNMNEYLKELGELAEINESITETFFIGNERYDETKPKYELLSSHVGRRSFVCLCIAKGIGIQIIMKWTGHSDYKSMKPYIEVADSTKAIEMQKLNF